MAQGAITPGLLDAQHNLATLLSYQERHAEALAIHEAVRAGCEELRQVIGEWDERSALESLVVQSALAIALAQTFLDRPAAAERTLLAAIQETTESGDTLNRGHACTNLAHLYQRTGRYAEALEQLDLAAADLLGTDDSDAAVERWPASDVLFLEQATVYLALNLLPEAAAALRPRCRFRAHGPALRARPGVLLQWTPGRRATSMAGGRCQPGPGGRPVRRPAERLLAQPGAVTEAGLAAAQGDGATALTLLAALLGPAARADEEPLRWDVPVRAEASCWRAAGRGGR